MAKKFKDYYNKACAELIAGKIQGIDVTFPAGEFIKSVEKGVRGKSMLERQDVFAAELYRAFGGDYFRGLKVFSQIVGPELQQDTGMFKEGWWLWPIGRFVELYGPDHLDESLDFIYELTKRFTGEFAIRPLLEKYPEQVFCRLKKWSKDENVHVRRLASEGMRIKLPWAKRLDTSLGHFDDFCEVLSNLRHSPEKFVQKSVGNNLNDLMKVDPEKAHRLIAKWELGEDSKALRWIIKHGKRTLK
jgi:3-methyladenine DNA glycosylase AlkC